MKTVCHKRQEASALRIQLEQHPMVYQPGGTGVLVTNWLAHHAQNLVTTQQDWVTGLG